MLYSGTPTREQYGSMHHICLEVPDIQAGRKTAVSRNYKDPNVQARVGRNRKWQLNLLDPDGTRVELMERRLRHNRPSTRKDRFITGIRRETVR